MYQAGSDTDPNKTPKRPTFSSSHKSACWRGLPLKRAPACKKSPQNKNSCLTKLFPTSTVTGFLVSKFVFMHRAPIFATCNLSPGLFTFLPTRFELTFVLMGSLTTASFQEETTRLQPHISEPSDTAQAPHFK